MSDYLELTKIKSILINDIQRSIKTDVKPLLKEENIDGEIGGYFAVPLLALTLIEYLGRLRYGCTKEGDGSKYAQLWIKKYMARSNIRYKKIGGLIYDMFRHGTVHKREPKQYLFTKNSGMGWIIVKGERQLEHLTLPNGRTLLFSLDQMIIDLENAIEYFYSDLESSQIIRTKFSNSYKKLRKPQWVPWLNRRKRYLKKDLQIIKGELKSW